METLSIVFERDSVAIATDVPTIRDMIVTAYGSMLSESASGTLSEIRICEAPGGVRITAISAHGSPPVDHVVPDLADDAFGVLRDLILQAFVSSRRDLFWLHASAAERDGEALLLAGPSGSGKSTLVALMCGMGWRLMADDIIAIRLDADLAIPFPQRPYRRIGPNREIAAGDVYTLPRAWTRELAGGVRQAAAPLAGIVFPTYSAGSHAHLSRLRRGDAAYAVLRECVNLRDLRDRAVPRAVALAQRLPMFRLEYSVAEHAALELQTVVSGRSSSADTAGEPRADDPVLAADLHRITKSLEET